MGRMICMLMPVTAAVRGHVFDDAENQLVYSWCFSQYKTDKQQLEIEKMTLASETISIIVPAHDFYV